MDFLRISIRHLTAEISITTQKVSQRITSIITRKKDVYYRLRQRFNIGNDSWATPIQYQNNRLTSFGQCLHQITLILAKCQICQVPRRFAIRVFTDTCHNHICTASCSYSFLDLRFIFIPIIALLIIGHSLFKNNFISAKLIAHGFINGIIGTSHLISQMTLPCIAPSTVQATHLIGIRAGQQNTFSLRQRKQIGFVLQKNHRFFRTLRSSLGKFFASKFQIILIISIGLVEQTKTILQTKYTTGSVIDTCHRHLTFIH